MRQVWLGSKYIAFLKANYNVQHMHIAFQLLKETRDLQILAIKISPTLPSQTAEIEGFAYQLVPDRV